VRLFRRERVFRSQHEPVLGTVLSVRLTTSSQAVADETTSGLLAEIDRLEGIFSVFRADSALNRWKAGTLESTHVPELDSLLRAAWFWQQVSSGRFNPAIGSLTDRWLQAQAESLLPAREELLDLADAIRTPPFSPAGARQGDCSALNFNAFAKGRVVDLATKHVLNAEVADVLVNIGGDLLHRGPAPVLVGVENPNRPYDNEPPICAVEIWNQGMATSGRARRGFEITGRWFSHVIDPLTGWPTDHIASASVVAKDTSTADVVATVLSVLPPDDGLSWLQQLGPNGPDGTPLGPIACLMLTPAGELFTNPEWDAISRPPST
jgi:FAD:protein FMN transferase